MDSNQLHLDQLEQQQTRKNAARDINKAINKWTRDRTEVASKRWVWELIQNSLDVQTKYQRGKYKIKIDWEEDSKRLLFAFNAGPFTSQDLVALITGGSSKPFESGRESELLGRFGSGFLVSHILSKRVDIRGKICPSAEEFADTKEFSISMDRSSGNEQGILENIAACYNQAEEVIVESSVWDAQYSYTILDNIGETAAEQGIDILNDLIPYLGCFIDSIESVEINGTLIRWREANCPSLSAYPQIQIIETVRNDEETIGQVMIFSDEQQDQQIAFPVHLTTNGNIRLNELNEVPRIFISVPFIGTEKLGIPFVINARELEPSEERDGVYLAKDSKETELNRRIIEQSYELYKKALNSIAGIKADGIINILPFEIPQHNSVATSDFFRSQSVRILPEILDDVNCVFCSDGLQTTNNCYFPVPFIREGENNEKLLHSIDDFPKEIFYQFYDLCITLKTDNPAPVRDEAHRWQEILRSWNKLNTDLSINYYYVEDLISTIEDCREVDGEKHYFPGLSDLSNIVASDSKQFLLKVLQFLDVLFNTKTIESSLANRLLVTQVGTICGSNNISIGGASTSIAIDNNIPEDIKDISKGIDAPYQLRHKLLDKEFEHFGIIEDLGLPKLSLEGSIEELLQYKPEASDKAEISEEVRDAWIQLFLYCAQNGNSQLLKKLPIFLQPNYISYVSDELLFPPFELLKIEKIYEAVFPSGKILMEQYFTDLDRDQTDKLLNVLNEEGITYKDVVTRTNILNIKKNNTAGLAMISNGNIFQSDHTIQGDFWNVPYWFPIMGKNMHGLDTTKLLLYFFADIICQRSKGWNKMVHYPCNCGNNHELYPAEWLMKLKTDSWLGISKVNEEGESRISQTEANKDSLTKLLGENGIKDLLKKREGTNLLSHLGFDKLSLSTTAFSMRSGIPQAQIESTFSDIMEPQTGYDDNKFSILQKLTQISDPGYLSNIEDHITKIKENSERAITNKEKGERIENTLRDILSNDYKLKVHKIDVGADIEVWPLDEGFDAGSIEVEGKQSCLVEVKLITAGNRVRMSKRQGENAYQTDKMYYLCVADFRDYAVSVLDMCEGELRDAIRSSTTFTSMAHQFADCFNGINSNDNIEVDFGGFWIWEKLWNAELGIEDWINTLKTESDRHV